MCGTTKPMKAICPATATARAANACGGDRVYGVRGEGHGGPGVCESFQTTFVSKSGEEIPVAISGAILYDDEGDEDGTIGFATGGIG